MPNLASLLAPYAKKRHLDLRALLAIAGHEGASGGIGDGGHAFGPFQMNNAGGVLTGKFGGQSPQQINAWAWSPAGIRYALDGIANVASGLQGADAVRAIATRYERPANVQAEIQDALAHYGKGGLSAPAPSAPSPAGAGGGLGLLGSLIDRTNQDLGLGGNFSNLVNAAWGTPSPGPGGKAGVGQGGLPPLKPKGVASSLANVGGVQVDSAIGGQVANILKQFGVTPSSGYRSAQHNASVGGAPHSDHLSGDAVDFVGNPSQLSALYGWAQKQHFPYLEPMAQAKNHVHISFRR